MALTDLLRRFPLLYHFTDRRNLAMIRELGGVYPFATLREMGKEIPAPGGNQLSHNLDQRKGLDKYVHLCLRSSYRMEYVAHRDGRIKDSIFLEVSSEVLRWEGVQFTPDVANKSGVPIYPIEEAEDLIVSSSMTSRQSTCEILVPQRVPLELIRNLPNG